MFTIIPIGKQLIKGETSSGKNSFGEAQRFEVIHEKNLFSAIVRYNSWSTFERDIVCIETKGQPILNTVIGRMRLSIYDYDEKWDWISLKTAILKNQQPPHATLHQCSFDYYNDHLNIDLNKVLPSFGTCKLGTKELLLNVTGRNKNELCLLFEKDKPQIAVAAFVVTRILSLLKTHIE